MPMAFRRRGHTVRTVQVYSSHGPVHNKSNRWRHWSLTNQSRGSQRCSETLEAVDAGETSGADTAAVETLSVL